MANQDLKTTRSRPQIEGYGIPKSKKGMLEWEFVNEQMGAALNYWLGTVTPEGRPHSIPCWGVWLENRFFFGGGLQTRHMRNIQHNPAVVVHLESGDDVVIIEGDVQRITDADLIQRSAQAGKMKYGMGHDPSESSEPVFAVIPKRVFAWTGGLGSATRWTVEE